MGRVPECGGGLYRRPTSARRVHDPAVQHRSSPTLEVPRPRNQRSPPRFRSCARNHPRSRILKPRNDRAEPATTTVAPTPLTPSELHTEPLDAPRARSWKTSPTTATYLETSSCVPLPQITRLPTPPRLRHHHHHQRRTRDAPRPHPLPNPAKQTRRSRTTRGRSAGHIITTPPLQQQQRLRILSTRRTAAGRTRGARCCLLPRLRL